MQGMSRPVGASGPLATWVADGILKLARDGPKELGTGGKVWYGNGATIAAKFGAEMARLCVLGGAEDIGCRYRGSAHWLSGLGTRNWRQQTSS